MLLYDSSDSLPLSVHLSTSMLAHLHANLNFAIYSLSSQTFPAVYRRLAVGMVARCCHRTTPSNVDAAVNGNRDGHSMYGREIGCAGGVDVCRALITVECHQLHARDSRLS